MGNLGIFDASQSTPEVKLEDDDEAEEPEPAITAFKLHSRTISAFQFDPTDSNYLYSASYDSSVRKLDLAKGIAVEVYAPPVNEDEPLSGVELASTDPHTLYFSTLNGRFGRYDMRDPKSLDIYQLSEKKIGGFSLHPRFPHLVATASLDRTLKIWDLRKVTGKGDERAPAMLGEHYSRLSVSCALWNEHGGLATTSYDDTIKIYDFSSAESWATGQEIGDEGMEPVVEVPHNNQTGRWVTMSVPN
jgi:WD40 repeat protein